MSIQRFFRKAGGQAVRLFSKVKDNAPAILKKVSDISGQVGKGLSVGAPIVSSIGMATGQPELIALGAGMQAGAVGARKLSQVSNQGSIIADKDANLLERAKAGVKMKQVIYN
jgi:hypothetical protein